MELEIYDKKCSSLKVTGPAIRITKAGVIYFNKPAIDLLNLAGGNSVSFANDKARPKDWYLFRDADGLPLKPKSGKSNANKVPSLGIATSVICSKMRQTLSLPADKNISIEIAQEPTVENSKSLHALITSKIK